VSRKEHRHPEARDKSILYSESEKVQGQIDYFLVLQRVEFSDHLLDKAEMERCLER
jgi:hypothetical protein